MQELRCNDNRIQHGYKITTALTHSISSQITNYQRRSQSTHVDHHVLSQTTTYHRRSQPTYVDHHVLSRITTYHRRSSVASRALRIRLIADAAAFTISELSNSSRCADTNVVMQVILERLHIHHWRFRDVYVCESRAECGLAVSSVQSTTSHRSSAQEHTRARRIAAQTKGKTKTMLQPHMPKVQKQYRNSRGTDTRVGSKLPGVSKA